MKVNTPRMIESNALYQLPEIKERLGIQNHAWRTLVRRGMPVIRVGRRGYVRGSEAIDFLSNLKPPNPR